jgi:hypothetical protein
MLKNTFKKIKRWFNGQCYDCGRQKISYWYDYVCPYCDLCPAGSSKSYKELDEEKKTKE